MCFDEMCPNTKYEPCQIDSSEVTVKCAVFRLTFRQTDGQTDQSKTIWPQSFDVGDEIYPNSRCLDLFSLTPMDSCLQTFEKIWLSWGFELALPGFKSCLIISLKLNTFLNDKILDFYKLAAFADKQ